MTKICYKSARGFFSNEFELCMDGHAGFNPGNDIVCSALSCLFFALANYLEDIGAKPLVEYDAASGRGFIKCRGFIRVQWAFRFCVFAFRMLESVYPDNVCVIYL